MFQPSQPHKNARNVTELSPTLEPAIHKLAHIRGKSKTQKIQVVKLAPGMPQANHIARTPAPILQRLNRVLHSARREIFQKRIAGAQRKKSQRRPRARKRLRKKPVHDFECSSVASHREELSNAPLIGASNQLDCVTGATRQRDVQLNTSAPDAFERGVSKPPASSSTSRRIYDREKARSHRAQSRP